MTSSRDELAGDHHLFQRALRAWLEQGHADHWRGLNPPTSIESLAVSGELVRFLYAEEWGRYGWPTAAGGLGGTELHLAVLFEELGRRGIPVPEQYAVLQVLGPPLVHYSPDLSARYLGPFLRGEEWWGQGFSEPEAGSDLASLRTRATRTDDGWVINGQKLWTSHGVGARKLVVLARTGTPESRHRGLSLFLVDADTPGITIRGIALSNGREELAEVFYDDVRIPADRIIGQEGGGWAVAMYLMQYERGLWAWLRNSTLFHQLDDLGGMVEPDDLARRRLGELYLDIAGLRAKAAITVTALAAGGVVGPEASSDKIMLGVAETGLLDAARDLLGDEFVWSDDPAIRHLRELWWWSRTTTIYGGSAEVQRQIVADRVLNLPREAK
jgi:alkylation response protein AidB-like acyl-CoA dehydrogenase